MIVKFNENAKCLAAIWCRENNIYGKVNNTLCKTLEIDVGLPYYIYANENQIDFVASDGEITQLSDELIEMAPIPDDVL